MNARLFIPLELVLLLGLASCASQEERDHRGRDDPGKTTEQVSAEDAEADLETLRGLYVFGHEVRSLRPCGEDETLWVVDRTALLRDLHAALTPETSPYAEVFVAIRGHTGPKLEEGFGTAYDGTLEVKEILYAAGEGFGCDFDWNRFLYRAQGNEPFWTLEVLPTHMRLTRPGQDDLKWSDVKQSRRETTIVFHGTDAGQPAVELTIEPRPSRDSMSGAYYGLSARLDLNGQSLRGNALPGAATVGY